MENKEMENKEMENKEINFRSSYLLRLIKGDWNPLTPNRLVVSDKFVEYRRRNWFLVSVDSEDMHWERIIGVSVDKHLFGATVKVKGTGGKGDSIYLHSVWKSTANKIKKECQKYISVHTQQGAGKAFADVVADQFAKNNTGNAVSSADELLKYKSMLDQGIIDQEEFKQKKKELL